MALLISDLVYADDHHHDSNQPKELEHEHDQAHNHHAR